ncbi:SLP adapter and CSK-interacting membrane protein [Molossus molossus]|uniref:SLP adaptor and CSK interacting membrane protein n=1 Tax=Molossus molossus TaxID=27622 RepID=A0A7J8D268_MOLMO|nr:SLP adapter and CSK-interacting membrane protein [Molossus molossus]KAF6417062.1 SLP adaptor and CSK interacting membrane protein [Molossus molossus]
MLAGQESTAMDWWRDKFWIILAAAIITVSVVLGLVLYCVCRRLLRQGKKLEIAKPLKQIHKDEEMMYENVVDQLPPLPPRGLLLQQDAAPKETPSESPAYSLVNKDRNMKTVSIPSYIEPECDYDDVEIPADMKKHHFETTISSFW